MAVFYSTFLVFFLPLLSFWLSASKQYWMHFFCVELRRDLSLHSGRSPPANLNFKKIQIGGNDMEGNYPKRRKDKYNPYTIWEKDGHYYISFRDGQDIFHKFEIKKALYDAFDSFELRDISYLHQWDKYIEHSEVWESTLNHRAFHPPENVEEIVLKNMQIEKLHKAIKKLPEVQRHRVMLYFFEGLTYEQIAMQENCTKMPVKRSIDAALEKLKKEIKK